MFNNNKIDDRIGFNFYNLDLRSKSPGKVARDSIARFWEQIYKRQIDNEVDFPEATTTITLMLKISKWIKLQEIYKVILDKVLQEDKLDDYEIKTIQDYTLGYYSQYPADDSGQKWKLKHNYPEESEVLSSAYRFVMRLSEGSTEVGRCNLEGCNNLFLVGDPGKPQKYCSAGIEPGLTRYGRKWKLKI